MGNDGSEDVTPENKKVELSMYVRLKVRLWRKGPKTKERESSI